LKKVLSIVLTTLAIFIFILSIGIMLIGTRAVQKNEPLFIFDYSFTIIPSTSMVGDEDDSLDQWDIAIVKKMGYETIEVGDVIVFQSEINDIPAMIIHRVVGPHPSGGFETKGDNNGSADLNPVTEANFQAMYVSKITFLKPIARVAAEQKGLLFALISVILLAMVISEVFHIIKMMKKTQEEKLKKEHDAKLKEELYLEVLAEESKKKSQDN